MGRVLEDIHLLDKYLATGAHSILLIGWIGDSRCSQIPE